MDAASPAVILSLSGEPLNVDLNNVTTIAESRACVASALACCAMNVRLTLKDQDFSEGVLEDSRNLAKLSGKVLTVVLVPVILCRGFAQQGGRGGCWNAYTCNSCERILLSPDAKCTLISVTNEDSSSSCVNTQTVKWDVLLGNYKVKDGVALCSWSAHLHRSFGYGSGLCFFDIDVKNFDKPWNFSHSSSSFKWTRIMLPDGPEEMARESLLDRLPSDADLLMEEVFAKHVDDSDLRHFRDWHNVDDGVPAQLLKDVCRQHRQQMQTTPCDAFSVVIANDQLPIAIAKEAVQWWRLDEFAEKDVLEKIDGGLVGWDFDNGFILGVSMKVKLAEVDHTNVNNPPNLSVDGQMNELLALIQRGDECQLPSLEKLTAMKQAPPSRGKLSPLSRRQWKPVTYTNIKSVAESLSMFYERANLNLKVKLISFGNLSVVGDETGVVCVKVNCPKTFHLLKKLKLGASIIIRKAIVRLRRGFGQPYCIHVDVDKDAGSIKESRDLFQFEPDQEHNISAKGLSMEQVCEAWEAVE